MVIYYSLLVIIPGNLETVVVILDLIILQLLRLKNVMCMWQCAVSIATHLISKFSSIHIILLLTEIQLLKLFQLIRQAFELTSMHCR
jgi:hypothetical protein